jgi:regulator of replication initiation timing
MTPTENSDKAQRIDRLASSLMKIGNELVKENEALKIENRQLKYNLKKQKAYTARALPNTLFEKYETSLKVLRTMLNKAGLTLGAETADYLLNELHQIAKNKK